MHSKNEDNPIKRMADLLRQGATLTDLSCPACFAPLFRLKDNTLWCEQDQKKVIIVKEDKQTQRTSQTNTAYDNLENTLLTKIQTFEDKIGKTEDLEEIQKL
ncbi:MAG: hypothetical protein LBE70_05235, partial [Nitrososphaerota archaeon]|nr:hypothetical protein [Nitrososphaerota archaeon]